jgi:hypothetical protein
VPGELNRGAKHGRGRGAPPPTHPPEYQPSATTLSLSNLFLIHHSRPAPRAATPASPADPPPPPKQRGFGKAGPAATPAPAPKARPRGGRGGSVTKQTTTQDAAVARALALADANPSPASKQRAASSASPINPAEAAAGRVDRVTVAGWGPLEEGEGEGAARAAPVVPGGSASDAATAAALGNLQVVSYARGGAVSGGAGGGRSGADPAPPPSQQQQQQQGEAGEEGEDTRPLYTRLARTLEALHASGALAPPSGSKKAAGSRERGPPPFERWVWRDGRYAAFLAGTASTHAALEGAVGGALREAARAGAGGGAGEGGGGAGLSPAFRVLASLGADAGLDRSAAAAADLAALVATAAKEEAKKKKATSGGGGGGLASAGPPLTAPPDPPGAAKLAATYLHALGRRCAAGVGQAGRAGGATSPAPAPATAAGAAAAAAAARGPPLAPADADALRLFANAYALHVTHLTTGTRVGAAATEALGLFGRRATALYDGYELSAALPTPLADPLRVFRARVDAVGEFMPEAGWGVVESELVGAVQRAGGLYEAVARDD